MPVPGPARRRPELDHHRLRVGAARCGVKHSALVSERDLARVRIVRAQELVHERARASSRVRASIAHRMRLRGYYYIFFAVAALAGALRVPLGPPVDRGALTRALDGSRRFEDGQICQRPEFREALGCGDGDSGDGDRGAVDALYDAMTGGRGPTLRRTADVARWKTDEKAFAAAVGAGRAYSLGVEVGFNVLQTTVYYVLFASAAARELLGRELLLSRGAVDPSDAAVGVALAAAAAIATTRGIKGS